MSAMPHWNTAHPFDSGGHFAIESRASWKACIAEPIDPEGFAALESLAEGDDDFLADLVSTYCEQAVELLASARTAADAGLARPLISAIHGLNGSSRNIGALPLARLCTAIELDSHINPDPAWLGEMVALLSEPLDAVLRFLEPAAHPSAPRAAEYSASGEQPPFFSRT